MLATTFASGFTLCHVAVHNRHFGSVWFEDSCWFYPLLGWQMAAIGRYVGCEYFVARLCSNERNGFLSQNKPSTNPVNQDATVEEALFNQWPPFGWVSSDGGGGGDGEGVAGVEGVDGAEELQAPLVAPLPGLALLQPTSSWREGGEGKGRGEPGRRLA